MYVEYSSNNSGGSWWLDDDDWKKLEAAGWIVVWNHLVHLTTEDGNYQRGPDGIPLMVHIDNAPPQKYPMFVKKDEHGEYRWLGCLAKYAYKPNCDNLRAAADDWENVTGKSATDAGCPCCGQPHNFTLYGDDGTYIESGPTASYAASW